MRCPLCLKKRKRLLLQPEVPDTVTSQYNFPAAAPDANEAGLKISRVPPITDIRKQRQPPGTFQGSVSETRFPPNMNASSSSETSRCQIEMTSRRPNIATTCRKVFIEPRLPLLVDLTSDDDDAKVSGGLFPQKIASGNFPNLNSGHRSNLTQPNGNSRPHKKAKMVNLSTFSKPGQKYINTFQTQETTVKPSTVINNNPNIDSCGRQCSSIFVENNLVTSLAADTVQNVSNLPSFSSQLMTKKTSPPMADIPVTGAEFTDLAYFSSK